jgi:DNA-binding CsgD family transcriptional regulator
MLAEIIPRTESSLLDSLTPREREIIQWLCEGKSNWEIGQIVGCSEGTVKKHLQHVYPKLGMESRMQVVNLLLRKSPDGIASIADILKSAGARVVASSASVALAMAEAIFGWDLTSDFL